MRNLGEYHDLYVQTDTSLLTDVFEKFRNTCIEIQTGSFLFLICTWISMASEMLLMFEARIGDGICQLVHRYAKANNKYMKIYDKSIDS